jgi:hypothetical protein
VEVPDPRPRRQVHQGVRRCLALRRGGGDLHARSGAQCQRVRRTLGWDGPPGVSRSAT